MLATSGLALAAPSANRSGAISPSEATEEKVSLSDRFGLWLGFHPCDQDAFLSMIRGYCSAAGIEIDRRSILLKDPIKELGDYEISIRLHKHVEATLKVSVVAE